MGPAVYPLPALTAQAIVARTYAYCAIHAWVAADDDSPDYWADCKREINNSNQFQVFTPGYFEILTEPQQQLIQTAVADYGYLIAPDYPEEGPIFAEFSGDAYEQTQDGGNYSYLRGVADPISAACDARDFGHGHGMSQEGAARWARGNQCANLNNGDEPWSGQWEDPREIAFHYYNRVQLMDETGNPKAGVDRWNLLSHTIPVELDNNQSYTVSVNLQNTSLSDWAGEVVLGYHWTAPGASPYSDEEGWQVVVSDLTVLTSQGSNLAVVLTTPTEGGVYELHWDVGRQGEGITWFGNQSNGAYAEWPHWQQVIIITSNGPSTATPSPSSTAPPASPTPPPNPTSTATSFPNPTPSPAPVTATPISTAPSPTATPTATGGGCVAEEMVAGLPNREQKVQLAQLYTLRDTFLANEANGQRYIDLYYRHSPELVRLLMRDESLRTEAQALLVALRPILHPLTSPKVEATPLTASQVGRIDTFLAQMQGQVSPALAAETVWWRAQLPDWVGLTSPEIWLKINDRFPTP